MIATKSNYLLSLTSCYYSTNVWTLMDDFLYLTLWRSGIIFFALPFAGYAEIVCRDFLLLRGRGYAGLRPRAI